MKPYRPTDVCAVITTFKPDKYFGFRCGVVLQQVGMIVIVNDSGDNLVELHLDEILPLSRNLLVHHNKFNLGIAASLNTGCEIALKNGYRWVLTLDDDTLIADNMVEIIISEFSKMNDSHAKKVAAIGMLYDESRCNSSFRQQVIHPVESRLKKEIITSGTMMSLEKFCNVGQFNEELFIDFVDYEYCYNARRKGYSVLQLQMVGMKHPIGNALHSSFLGVDVVSDNHSPFRYYYIFRNSTWFAIKIFFYEPISSIIICIGNIRKIVLMLLYESEKSIKLKYALMGFIDGVLRKLGRRVPPL